MKRITVLAIAAVVLLLAGAGTAVAEGNEQPDNVFAFANAPGAITVTWSHSADGVFFFVVEQQTPFAEFTPDRDKRIWTITGLTPSTTYRYRVCAVFDTNRVCSDANGVGYASATTMPPEQSSGAQRPPAPRIVSHESGDTWVRVCWEGNDAYESYFVNVHEKGAPLSTVRTIDHENGGKQGCQRVNGLQSGRTYILAVQGCSETFFGIGGDQCYDWSAGYEVRTLGSAPAGTSTGSNDFNGDGRGDILWHNASSNETQLWLMSDSRLTSRATVVGEDGKPIFVGLPWRIVGSNDFNGDGKADILWHNDSNNGIQIWLMNGHRIAGRVTVVAEDGKPIFVGLPWRIVGTNDFNRDGKTDILWHNNSNNGIQIWQMDGHRITGRVTVVDEDGKPIFVGLPWRIVGTNDFNRDGKTDILWHNDSTNYMQIWQMDGSRITSRPMVLWEDGNYANVGLPWSIVGTNDFNRDGAADILWHNDSTNVMQVWQMDGNRLTGRPMVLGEGGSIAAVGLPWSIANH